MQRLENNVFYKSSSLPWSSFQPPCSCVFWNKWLEISPYLNFIPTVLIPELKCNVNTQVPIQNQTLVQHNKDITGSFIKIQTRGTSSDNEWQRVVQRVTTRGSKWLSDSEWQRVAQRETIDNEWQQMTMSGIEWQKVVQLAKMAHLIQKMDDCNSF